MEIFSGKSILKKIAIGKISYYRKDGRTVKRRTAEDTDAELRRYEEAVRKAEEELELLYDRAMKEVGAVNAAVFEVHRLMLEDEDYQESVRNIVEGQKVNAEYAVAVTEDNFVRMFSSMEDEYFKARAADVRDVSERLLAILSGNSTDCRVLTEPVILMAEDLAPSETVQLDKSMLLGFVTAQGSSNSHTAILARTMNIPALVSVPVKEEWDGHMAAVDGNTGTLYIDPDPETLEKLEGEKAKEEEKQQMLQMFRDKEDVTLDGRKVRLYGNIGSVADVAAVLENHAAGIGLFRSEFLYLERGDFPSEEEQFAVYRQVAEMMAGKEVVIRTLDIGADKKVEYFHLDTEENPALGYRAIRICLDRPEIFRTQLRAIYRASAYGKISVMFPMIISVDEVRRARAIADEVRQELKEAGIPFGDVSVGIMIETPAAAVMSRELAKEVDFFSIGTNDLIQYTLAIDRQNEKLDAYYDARHPAVLRLIEFVARNAHEEGCWVGICGELGADTELTEWFLQIGIDELSVSPSFLLPVRKAIRRSRASYGKKEGAGEKSGGGKEKTAGKKKCEEKGSASGEECTDLQR